MVQYFITNKQKKQGINESIIKSVSLGLLGCPSSMLLTNVMSIIIIISMDNALPLTFEKL